MIELVKPDTAAWIRTQAIARFPDYDVDRDAPMGRLLDSERPLLLFYVQDDFRLSDVSWSETIGFRVHYATREDPGPAEDVARVVAAWLWTLARPGPGCPVAAVTDLNGAVLVPGEYETAVLYGTAEMTTAGVYPRV